MIYLLSVFTDKHCTVDLKSWKVADCARRGMSNCLIVASSEADLYWLSFVMAILVTRLVSPSRNRWYSSSRICYISLGACWFSL